MAELVDKETLEVALSLIGTQAEKLVEAQDKLRTTRRFAMKKIEDCRNIRKTLAAREKAIEYMRGHIAHLNNLLKDKIAEDWEKPDE